MATVTVELAHGLTIGDVKHTQAELREVTLADIIAAQEESERAVPTPDGYALVSSPTMMGLHTLRRQIVRIGDYPGPLAVNEIKRLHRDDFEALQREADKLDKLTLGTVTDRGRDDGAPSGD
ncbi:MAG: phage tail assembly protein [Desulfobulbaceae bacterium]|nr:phage tail assembly protein [Desulfobulbaceae bacterium]